MTMHCPWGCEAGSDTLQTRTLKDTVQRRRRCKRCSQRWNTWEVEINPSLRNLTRKKKANVEPKAFS